MALLLMESFDFFTVPGVDETEFLAAGWEITGTWPDDIAMSAAGRYDGSNALAIGAGSAAFHTVTVSGTAIICQFAFSVDKLVDTYPIFVVKDDTPHDCFSVSVAADGSIKILDYDGAEVAASAAGVVAINTWYALAVSAVIATGTGGSVTVKIGTGDGGLATVAAATGVTTGGGDAVDRVFFQAPSDDDTTLVDDVVVMDGSATKPNTILGDVRISALLPDRNTGQNQWTREAGSDDFAMVDDPVPGGDDADGSYIQAEISQYETRVRTGSTLPSGAGAIHGVSVVTSMKGVGGQADVHSVIKSGSQETNGAERTVEADAYNLYRDYYGADPDSGAPFDTDIIRALQIGVKVATS